MGLVEVAKDFSGVHAVRAVSLTVPKGQAVAVVGPNGSGKTTLANLASGTISPSAGRVSVDGADLTGAAPTRFAGAGVVRTYQGLRLFEGLTVLDNVMVGAQRGTRPSLAAAWVRTPSFARRERRLRGDAMDALGEVGMAGFAARPVTALSHGQRRRVEMARALAARPDYLVLDEPSAGVDPEQLEALAGLIGRRRDAGTGVLLVEHDLGLVDRVADFVVGLDAGIVVARGPLADVIRHPALATVLGGQHGR